MSVDADPNTDLLRAARAAVSSHDGVSEALGALVTCLRPHLPISRVSLRVHDPIEDRLEIKGLWSDGETAVGIGVSIPTASTSFRELRRAGCSLLRRFEALPDPPTLLDQVLYDEGMRCWVVVPLRRAGAIVGLMNVSSRRPDAFTEEDLPFFDALGPSVEGALLEASGVA